MNIFAVQLMTISLGKTVNQKEVARLAGVARSAVSMYINGYSCLSKASEQKIANAIETLGYRPSRIARGLKEKRSLMIGIVYFGNPSGTVHDFVLLDLLYGVQKAALEEDYVASFFFREDLTMEETLSDVLKRNAEGIVFIEDNFDHAQIRALDIPKVVINRKVEGIPSVFADAGKGAYLATHYLLSRNHTGIGFIGGPLDQKTFRQRWDGFRMAMNEANAGIDENSVHHGARDNKDSYLAMMNILKRKNKLTGMICDNDIKAWGTMEAIKDFGLKVPENISVVGFDNITACAHLSPPLTTVEHPRKKIGYLGGKLLLEIIRNKIAGEDIVVPMNLIERASCAGNQWRS